MTVKFDKIQAQAMGSGDRNVCVPIALSIVLDNPYDEIYTHCKEAGRRKGGRMGDYQWMPILERMSQEVTTIDEPRQPNGSRYTAKTIHKMLDKSKRYLISFRGHMAAFVDGDLQDWTAGRKHRVKYVIEVSI